MIPAINIIGAPAINNNAMPGTGKIISGDSI